MRKPLIPLVAVLLATFVAAAPALAEKGGHGKGGGKPDKGTSHGNSHGGGPGNSGHSKGKGPKKFEASERSAIESYYRDEYSRSGNCPPGLAKKNNGCIPPGQAKKWSVGSHLPPDVHIAPLPPALVGTLVAPMPGYNYGYVDGGVVLFGVADRVIIDVVIPF
jgi:hypothetical protein